MKIFIDDMRKAPEGWHQARWPDEVINWMKTGEVEVVSLEIGTGYDIKLWIEKAVFEYSFKPPKIIIHTSNPVARFRMEQGVRAIHNLLKKIRKCNELKS